MKTEYDRFLYERDLLQQNADAYPIAGVDEAGRGPLAGPVAVAAVVLPRQWIESAIPDSLKDLNDSKQLTEKQREAYYEILQATPEIIKSVVMVDVDEIDRINILRATHQGMVRALAGISAQGVDIKHVLVDGCEVSAIPFAHTALVKGDAKSYSIAAASVLAKVQRDHLMVEYDKKWPEYGFAHHKGYGTKEHLAALRTYGPCSIHRRSFIHLEQQGELNLF